MLRRGNGYALRLADGREVTGGVGRSPRRWGPGEGRRRLEAGAPPAEVLDLLEAAGLPAAALRGEQAPALMRHAAGAWFLGSARDVLRACDRDALDAGVVGSDGLLEGRHGVADLLDLRCCRDDLVFSVAPAVLRSDRRLTIATRHPETARRHFAAAGAQPKIVHVDEPALAPDLGLADQWSNCARASSPVAGDGGPAGAGGGRGLQRAPRGGACRPRPAPW